MTAFVLRFLNVHDSFDIPGEQPALVQYGPNPALSDLQCVPSRYK